MNEVQVERNIGGKVVSISAGRYARQADAAVLVRMGGGVVLVTVVRAQPREGIDFFPLTVDYREFTSAAGKFPGGFIKREGRPTTKEILTMRMIDRPVRPLFPKGFRDEVQIQAWVLSADEEHDPDVLAMIGASAALRLSSIPWQGPTGSVRVGRVEGRLVLFPTYGELEVSDVDLLLCGHRDGLNMIEVGAHEVGEGDLVEAMKFGFEQAVLPICEMIEELASQAGKPKEWTPEEPDEALMSLLRDKAAARLREIWQIPGKKERKKAADELHLAIIEELCPPEEEPAYDPLKVGRYLQDLEEQVVREMVLREGRRIDGRGMDEIRPITCEVGLLPRTHGSAVFTRGETQVMVTATLGTVSDEQIVDGLTEEYSKKFMLHYNFPPFCVGEARRIVGPGRREIGHGALAERSLEAVLPDPERFPYTIRLVANVLESNGSSSMASVCGGTLALMDAGVPITQPVAGVSIGMVSEGSEHVLLTDIIGDEDHYGDMDFKVAGTGRGVTGVQLDLKTSHLPFEIISEALEKARVARRFILREMLQALPRPRAQVSEHAPKIIKMRIDPDKIGKIIGPGGKGVKRLEEETDSKIEIEYDGTVYISSKSLAGAQAARDRIEVLAEDVKVGRIYTGRVISIKDFGAFVELAPGQDALCHISELSDGYVRSVTDVCKVGDEITVKVIGIDEQGRVKVSRRAAMSETAPSTS